MRNLQVSTEISQLQHDSELKILSRHNTSNQIESNFIDKLNFVLYKDHGPEKSSHLQKESLAELSRTKDKKQQFKNLLKNTNLQFSKRFYVELNDIIM